MLHQILDLWRRMLREDGLIRLVSLFARRTLIVVELDDEHFCAVLRVRHLHDWLGIPPTFEFRLLALRYRSGMGCDNAGKECDRGDGASGEQQRNDERDRTRDEHASIRARTSNQRR